MCIILLTKICALQTFNQFIALTLNTSNFAREKRKQLICRHHICFSCVSIISIRLKICKRGSNSLNILNSLFAYSFKQVQKVNIRLNRQKICTRVAATIITTTTGQAKKRTRTISETYNFLDVST